MLKTRSKYFCGFWRRIPVWLAAFLLLQCGSPEPPCCLDNTPPPSSKETGTVGIRNFRQLHHSLSYLTQVETTEPRVAEAFESLKVKLSMDGNVEKISPALLLTATALTSAYCQTMIEKELDKDSVFFEGVDFNTTESLPLEIRRSLIDRMASRFWQRTTSVEEMAELLDLLQQVEKESDDTVTAVRSMLLSLCTCVASSIESLQL